MKKIITILGVLISTIIGIVLYGENNERTIADSRVKLHSMRDSRNSRDINDHNLNGSISNYGGRLHGGPTASGERFDQYAMTAAHKTLPLGTKVKVTNLDNGKSVVVRINDRGPYVKGRVLDLSRGSFSAIAPLQQGILKNVVIEVIEWGNQKYQKVSSSFNLFKPKQRIPRRTRTRTSHKRSGRRR